MLISSSELNWYPRDSRIVFVRYPDMKKVLVLGRWLLLKNIVKATAVLRGWFCLFQKDDFNILNWLLKTDVFLDIIMVQTTLNYFHYIFYWFRLKASHSLEVLFRADQIFRVSRYQVFLDINPEHIGTCSKSIIGFADRYKLSFVTSHFLLFKRYNEIQRVIWFPF